MQVILASSSFISLCINFFLKPKQAKKKKTKKNTRLHVVTTEKKKDLNTIIPSELRLDF